VIYNPDAPPLVNPRSLGNAWFVEKPELVESPNLELSDVNKIDPSKEAVISNSFKNLVKEPFYPFSAGDTIWLTSYQPNELHYKYHAGGERLVVFSEIYYPAGWNCYIDGKKSDYFRADFVLRAAIVPAGDHEIRFSFEPASYYTGNKISLASSILLILLFLGYIGSLFIRKPKLQADDPS
jgi:hypothetical protein